MQPILLTHFLTLVITKLNRESIYIILRMADYFDFFDDEIHCCEATDASNVIALQNLANLDVAEANT